MQRLDNDFSKSIDMVKNSIASIGSIDKTIYLLDLLK